MPFAIGELEINGPVQLAPGEAFIDGAVLEDGDLTIKVNSFHYDMAGVKGYFAGAMAQAVVDNTINYVYLDVNGTLQINTSNFPNDDVVHIRLAKVHTSSGVIIKITFVRAFFTSGSGAGAVIAALDGYIPLPSGAGFGSVLYYDGNEWVQLSPGSDGYFLTTHGVGFAPTWEQVVGGGGGSVTYGSPVSIGAANADGVSTSVSRADHTHAVVDLAISGQVQGSIIYFNGSNWIQLAPSTDGYVLSTHSAGQNPTWIYSPQLTNSLPVDIAKSPALIGTAATSARADHKHNVATDIAVAVADANAEGTSTSLARADHIHQLGGTVGGDLAGTLPNPTVTDLTITNEAQGDVLYFNGSNWVRLAASTDGYQLTTHSVGQNPTWDYSVQLSTPSNIPADIAKSPALVGESFRAARSDHKHNVNTAAPTSIGNVNSEGTSTALARADHVHALAGTVGGDLSGILPNPTVTDLTITNEEQGSILYFNGSNWVELSPGDDGYFLTTHGTGANPTWTDGGSSDVSLTNSAPVDVDANTAQVGVDITAARADHKHDVATAAAVSVGANNAEGSSASLARADHTHAVTDLSISSQAQGDILYFNGSNWVRLAAGIDGYQLTTHAAGQNPTWNSTLQIAITTDLPADVTKSVALVGESFRAARADHKHNINTAVPTSVGNANVEGSATSLARSDHVHALAGTVGGDLSGTLPNPTVIDLTIASEEQGSVLYFDGVNWIQLAPGTDGYFLTTHSTAQNPTWTDGTPLSRVTDFPADITKSPAVVGLSEYAARADHKHNISTAAASTLSGSNSEGTSTSLARADHNHALGGSIGGDLSGTLPNPTVVDLTITNEEQGSVLYFDGANWIQLAPGQDGYFLTTHSTAQSPTWSIGNQFARITDLPTNINKSPALVGISNYSARADHKHNIDTTTAVSTGAANSEGTSVSLARADHTHAVIDLDITNQEQGSVLYFDGSNWVQLSPGQDGYVLTTGGIGANPAWTLVSGGGSGVSLTNSPPIDVDTDAAEVGIANTAARSDHKHDVATASAVSIGATNEEGTSLSLARADHTHAVTDLAISSQAQGDILYFNGSNWVRLAASTDGYFLTTHSSSQNPTWTDGTPLSRVTDFPNDTTKAPALVGVSEYAARSDHKHNILTAVASTLSGSNSEGTSTALARADHNHALGGLVGGDLSGTLPNPTVIDLTITSEEQGSVLYYNGSNWVQLAPSTDGYFLATHSTGQNPTWIGGTSLARTTDLPTNTNKSPALVGTSAYGARADHKHNIDTASASSVGAINTEGTSTSLARSDHTHAVIDLNITNQEQGSVLYYNGSNWVQLSPGQDGYVLTTGGPGANPVWTLVSGSSGATLTNSPPVDIDTAAAEVGVANTAARSDHKHDIATASAISVGASNAEGSSLSLARADHTHAVTDLAISSQVQGDILYFNGSNWVRLAAGTDGYFLTTHSAGQNPTWTDGTPLARTTDLPIDTTKASALVGVSEYAARSDHKHNILTAAPSTIGDANTEGTSTALSRADHVHALGGSVGGDLSGTLPNPSVTDLTITNEEQGSVLYFDGSNWVQLAPGTDGYQLTTHSTGQNPTWNSTLQIAISTDFPADTTKAPALVGMSSRVARADHKHNIQTAAASTLSGSNSEGASTALARADHNHALGGSVGGDLSGTLPNPTVVDLTITSEQQGSVLFFDGSNWVQLSPGTDGYFLTTHGAAQNPTYTSGNPLARGTDLPTDVTKSSALVGTSAYGARSDHKHNISTASATSIGASNTEGTATSLARSDHTHAVTDLSISSQAQGDILYFNGSNWVRLAAGTDGYFLTTHGAGQNPNYTGINPIARTTDFPADITKSAALVGTSAYIARADHKHNISTSAASTLSGSNTEGASTALARADHNHALGGSVGGDLSGTLPNPTVVDLTITNEEQGSVLYFDGSNWVQLAPGTDGYYLTTHGIGQNPSYTGANPLARTTDLPADTTKAPAVVGTSAYGARSDHKHNISTASASTLSGSNSEGTSTSLARADHNHALGGSVGGDLSGTLPNPTVTDLTIASEEQGSILYYNGSNWVQLAPGQDGYQLTTHSTAQNPTWDSTLQLSSATDLPADVTKSSALIGDSFRAAKADHKHNVSTATAVSVGVSNAEGTSISLARADHTHAVTDLNISSQTQGSVLYYNGSNWVRLSPGTDGYVLTTHGEGQNPTWTEVTGGSGSVSFGSVVSIGASNVNGVNNTAARSDHQHAVVDLAITSQAQGDILYFNGANWVRLAAGTDGYQLTTHGAGQNPAWGGDINVGNNDLLNIKNALFAYEIDNGNSGASITINWNDGQKQAITLTDNCTFTFTDPIGVGNVLIRLIQDGTGGRTVTWPGTVVWANGSAPTLSTTAAGVDIVSFYWNGANYYGAGSVRFTTSADQGSILYFDGSNWVNLSPGTDGYFLQTQGSSSNPIWAGINPLARATDLPADTTKASAIVGISEYAARADHKHNISTAAASTLSGSNSEGTSTSLARADHNHALGGSVGGDLSGTLPNPTVVDLTISSEEQGSVLYYNGSNWVQLSPGSDGYVLTTHGLNQNPTWTEVSGGGGGGVSFGSVVSIGASTVNGVNNTAARSDHQHAVTDLAITSQAQGDILYFDGNNWVRLAASATDGYFLQSRSTDSNPEWSNTFRVGINANANDLVNLKTATFGSEISNGNSGTTFTIDWRSGQKQTITLTGACTFTFSAPFGPSNLLLRIVQDGTGSRTVTWPANVRWAGGSAPTLSTAASSIDIVTFYYNGTHYYGVASLNFS